MHNVSRFKLDIDRPIGGDMNLIGGGELLIQIAVEIMHFPPPLVTNHENIRRFDLASVHSPVVHVHRAMRAVYGEPRQQPQTKNEDQAENKQRDGQTADGNPCLAPAAINRERAR